MSRIVKQTAEEREMSELYRYNESRRMADILIGKGYEVHYTFFPDKQWFMGITVGGIYKKFTCKDKGDGSFGELYVLFNKLNQEK